MSDQQSDQFAIVELFGHARIAGRISEQTFGGTTMARVDVPEVKYVEKRFDSISEVAHTIAAHTRSFGGAAIYSINWVDQAAATLAAQQIKHSPIQPYTMQDALREMSDRQRQMLLAAPIHDGEGSVY
jgi:hypothetical protein